MRLCESQPRHRAAKGHNSQLECGTPGSSVAGDALDLDREHEDGVPRDLGRPPTTAVGQPSTVQCIRQCTHGSARGSARGIARGSARAVQNAQCMCVCKVLEASASKGAPGRDVQLPLVALHHQLHGLGPPFDHLVGRELARLAPVVGAVELVSVGIVGGGATLIMAEAPVR